MEQLKGTQSVMRGVNPRPHLIIVAQNYIVLGNNAPVLFLFLFDFFSKLCYTYIKNKYGSD